MLANQVVVPKSKQVADETGVQETPVSNDLVVFPVPNGFVPPDGVQPGQSFEVIARVQYTKGQMILEAIEGNEVRMASTIKRSKAQKDASFENAVEQGLSETKTGGSAGMA
jgi:hypothetical protein